MEQRSEEHIAIRTLQAAQVGESPAAHGACVWRRVSGEETAHVVRAPVVVLVLLHRLGLRELLLRLRERLFPVR